MFSKDEDKENIVVKDDESIFEDFDGDNTMENMLDLFIFHRKDATLIDWFSFISFIVFFFVNVGCVSFNLYKALTTESKLDGSDDINQNSIIIDTPTKVLYITEFSVIMLFLIIALYNFILLIFNSSSKLYLSNAANFTRLVREFSCFSLVPLFNVNTIMGIYNDIAVTFDEERKKYADRSKLWDGIWGVGTKDVQKTSDAVELVVENEDVPINMEQHGSSDNVQESWFKIFKRSKFFLHLVSIFIFIGFFLSLVALLGLAFFACVALYIKTRHVGNFIKRTSDTFDVYKWFNFITFIMNIASLSQQSPAIKLIIYQLKVLTRKAHHNEYRRRKQNRIKENASKFDADKDQEGIQPPKIIIHRKRISRTQDDTDIDNIKNEEIDTDKLIPNSNLKHQNSKLSSESVNSV